MSPSHCRQLSHDIISETTKHTQIHCTCTVRDFCTLRGCNGRRGRIPLSWFYVKIHPNIKLVHWRSIEEPLSQMRDPLWYRAAQAHQKKRSPPTKSLRLNSKAGNNRWRQTGRWKTRQRCLHPRHWSQQSSCQAKKFWPEEKLSQSLWI